MGNLKFNFKKLTVRTAMIMADAVYLYLNIIFMSSWEQMRNYATLAHASKFQCLIC